jgi:hypothetical protein
MARLSRVERAQKARERAKRTILGLVAASDGRLVGKLRLNKAFYRAHLLYFEETGLELTGYPIVHLEQGPGIDNADDLIDELEQEGRLLESIGNGPRKRERVYELVGTPVSDEDVDKTNAIKRAVVWANALTEEELKLGSHNRSWEESGMGKQQNIFVDVLSSERVLSIRAEADERLAKIEDLLPSV